MKCFIILCAFLMALPIQRAWSACGLTLTATDINVNWSLSFTSIAVSVQVNRANSEACSYALGFTKGNGANYDSRRGEDTGKTIRYQLYQDSALTKILKDDPDVVSLDEVVQGGFQEGPTPISQTVNYYFEIPYNLATTPSLVSAGTFTDTFTINVYEVSALPLGVPVDSGSINITVSVPKMIALSLLDTGAAFQEGALLKSADFVILTEGESSAMDIRVRTNAGFTITFSSTNNGNMRHTNPLKPSLVPYTFYANGVSLDLSNSLAVPVTGLSGVGSTALEGLAYPLKLVIGNVSSSGILSGPHADDITITATTTE